jgi:hypothetical protein
MSAHPKPASIADENQRLAELLRESRERFLASVSDVTDDNCRCRPAEGCWSILECAEHVALAEMGMFRLLNATRRPRPAGAPDREQFFLENMTDRSRKVQAPERGRPTGRFPTLEAARQQFEAAREETIRSVEANEEDLRAIEVTHPIFDAVSAYEMVIILAKHTERHALQIEEIKKSPAFLAGEGNRS